MTLKELQKIRRLEELKGHYYPIPDDIYHKIPAEYRPENNKFTWKKLLGVCISIWIFVGTIMTLADEGLQVETVGPSIPLLVIAIGIFVFCVSGHVHVDSDSQIVEGLIKKIDIYPVWVWWKKTNVFIATMYIPSLRKEIKVAVSKNESVGDYMLMAQRKDLKFNIQMKCAYIPKDIDENV